MAARSQFPRSTVRTGIAALPWRVRLPEVHPRAWPERFAPTRRSLAIGFGLLAVALGGYLLARETPMFAIRGIEVEGGSPRVAAQVRQALASFVGKPLVGLDGSAVQREVDALPTVVRSSYDRAFPHTLRVTIVPERPAAVLRRGAESRLVSIRGRVMQRLPALSDRRLPRIWVSGHTPVTIGAELDATGAAVAARAVGLAGAFARRVATASYTAGTLVFHLKSGLQLLLGDGSRVRLKVAVAARTLPAVPSGSTFLDVSVPGRPVSGVGSPAFETLQSSSRG